MARNATIELPAKTWTELTAGNVTTLRVQNLGHQPIMILATVGSVEPTSRDGGLMIQPGFGLTADVTLEHLFPGVAGANRVWAVSPISGAASVSHA